MKKPWQTKEWRDKRAELIKDKKCVWCGSLERLTIHHPIRLDVGSYDYYMSLKETEVLCARCHFALHKGMHLCPQCKTHYVKNNFKTCFHCLPLDMQKKIIKEREEEEIKEREEEEFEQDLECKDLEAAIGNEKLMKKYIKNHPGA